MVDSDEGIQHRKHQSVRRERETDIHTETDRLGEERRAREIRLLD